MRRTTWLVVGAVAALGALAALDAVRGGSDTPPRRDARPPASSAASGVADLPEVGGVLYYTDGDCRLRAIHLPELREASAPVWRNCTFALSPDGSSAWLEDTSWSPDGSARVRTEGNAIAVTALSGESETFPGSAPSWRRDGTLTYVRGGELVTWPDGEVLLTAADLRGPTAEVDAGFGRITRFRVEETAWLTETRVAAVLRVDRTRAPRMHILAFYEGTRGWVALTGGAISDVEVSPTGEFVAARTGGPPGFAIVDHAGLSVQGPPLTTFRALTWAPTGIWAAIATRANVFVFRPRHDPAAPLVRRLPFAANDLAWRAEPTS